MITIDNYLDNHYIHRSNWLRAAVLGANDGIISISSLAIGDATAAALVAGALSMANEINQANPIQAALASGAVFTVGGVLPLLVIHFAPLLTMEYWLYGSSIVFLIILGATDAKQVVPVFQKQSCELPFGEQLQWAYQHGEVTFSE